MVLSENYTLAIHEGEVDYTHLPSFYQAKKAAEAHLLLQAKIIKSLKLEEFASIPELRSAVQGLYLGEGVSIQFVEVYHPSPASAAKHLLRFPLLGQDTNHVLNALLSNNPSNIYYSQLVQIRSLSGGTMTRVKQTLEEQINRQLKPTLADLIETPPVAISRS